ncbi:hypothetical protein ACERK3_12625 [Phycisphaerales bacterium AB-hyl4]|uniref:Small CPxCG-related zinc finger protein n=1 Tax=Natronomicrosphaera hydrolytica TaxID=3242702 RepID=A0ABV4U8J7_9BACT
MKVTSTDERPGVSLRGRPWLAVMFKCCQAYSRVYRNREATAYEGRCPKCHRPLRVAIGPGGTSTRFFEAL